jgi:hypothetical protein
MPTTPSTARRLDRAIDELLAGVPAGVAAGIAGLDGRDRVPLGTADRLRLALAPASVAPRFEALLGARLAGLGPGRDTGPWALRHPGRLIVTGAVGSAVGVGVTAYAVWRSTRRASTHRLRYR